jgi:hypothetical protein
MQMWIVPAVDMSKEHHGPAEVKIEFEELLKMVGALTRELRRCGYFLKENKLIEKFAEAKARGPSHWREL